MKVNEIMAREVATGTKDANLGELAGIMWNRDCGVVPVLESDRIGGERRKASVYEKVVQAFQEICRNRLPGRLGRKAG